MSSIIMRHSSKDSEHDRSVQKNEPARGRFVVYVGNLMTSDLTDEEIEELIKKPAASSSNPAADRRSVEILSIKVFHNCLYVELDDEACAQAVVQGLHNQLFKSNKIQAYFLEETESSDLFTHNQKDVSQFLKEEEEEKASGDDDDARSTPARLDCELLAVNRQLRKYAESVHEKLKNSLFGLNARVTYLRNEAVATAALEDEDSAEQTSALVKEKLEEAVSRKLMYFIYVDSTNEQFNSLTLYVINAWQGRRRSQETAVKEFKNMPLNRALDYLKSDYLAFISLLKKNVAARHDHDESESEDESEDSEGFKLNTRQKKFLELLLKPIMAEHERVKLNDLDRLLTYLAKLKSELISATLAPKSAETSSQPVPLLSMQIEPPAEMTLSATQQHVQMPQIPSLLSMPYQMPPHLLMPPNLMQQFPLMPANYGLGLAGANPGGMSLLGQYPMTLSAANMSTAPPSLMSIQPNSAPAPSLMNLSLPPNYNNNNIPSNSLLGNPPPGAAYSNKSANSATSANNNNNNFKQR